MASDRPGLSERGAEEREQQHAQRHPHEETPTAVTVTVTKNGPYTIYGDFEVADQQGNTWEVSVDKPVALCRCGASANKPFCDGSHKVIGFESAPSPAGPLEADEADAGAPHEGGRPPEYGEPEGGDEHEAA